MEHFQKLSHGFAQTSLLPYWSCKKKSAGHCPFISLILKAHNENPNIMTSLDPSKQPDPPDPADDPSNPVPTIEIVTRSKFGQTENSASTANPAEKSELTSGHTEERYRHSEELGQGGMKKIEVVFDEGIKRKAAKATLHASRLNPGNINSFLREARLTAALEHPNIVPIYDIGSNEHGEPFFIMKYLDGRSLHSALNLYKNKDGTFRNDYPLDKILGYFRDICLAMEYAHSRGVLHLDLKPMNVHIAADGHVYLIDWGLARIQDDQTAPVHDDSDMKGLIQEPLDHTVMGVIKGSPGYMAPEQIFQDIMRLDARTDIYGLGGILYGILTGNPPISKDTFEKVCQSTIAGQIVPPQEIHAHVKNIQSLNDIAMKALATNPLNRYSSVRELIQDLDVLLDVSRSDKAKKPAGLMQQRKLSLVILLLALLVAYLIFRSNPVPSELNDKFELGPREITSSSNLDTSFNAQKTSFKDLAIKRLSPTSMYLSWDTTLDPTQVQKYNIYGGNVKNQWVFKSSTIGHAKNHILNKTGFSDSFFQIHAISANNKILDISPTLFLTPLTLFRPKMNGTIPGAQNLIAERISSNSAMVHWQPPPGYTMVDHYYVYYGMDEMGWFTRRLVKGDQVEYLIENLPTGQPWIQVEAYMDMDKPFKMSEKIDLPPPTQLNGTSKPIAHIKLDGTESILEAEYAHVVGAVMVENYVDFKHLAGDSIEWFFICPVEGRYKMGITYSLSKNRRPLKVSVDGKIFQELFDFPITSSWSSWQTATLTLPFKIGQHSFKLETCGFNGGNVDYISIKLDKPKNGNWERSQ